MKRIIILIILSTMLSGCFERAIRRDYYGRDYMNHYERDGDAGVNPDKRDR